MAVSRPPPHPSTLARKTLVQTKRTRGPGLPPHPGTLQRKVIAGPQRMEEPGPPHPVAFTLRKTEIRPPHPATTRPAFARAKGSPRTRVAQRADVGAPTIKAAGWRKILDTGFHDGKPIYIHYTSEAGYRAILADRAISDKKRGEKREGSKPGIYVNPSTQRFNPTNVEILLFLGNERYIGSGNYVAIFSSDNPIEDLGPVTQDSWVNEYKLFGDVALTRDNMVYAGPNPFPDVFES